MNKIMMDIARARIFLRNCYSLYVDEDSTPSSLLDEHRFTLSFPDVDRAVLTKVLYGEEISTSCVQLRLAWIGGKLVWRGDFAIRRALGGSERISIEVGEALGDPTKED